MEEADICSIYMVDRHSTFSSIVTCRLVVLTRYFACFTLEQYFHQHSRDLVQPAVPKS